MIFGKLRLGANALHTHNDSYVLESISAVSTRRPFLSAGVMVSGLTAMFGVSFIDILTIGEVISLILISGLSLTGGLTIGQLRLISRDLRGSPISEAIFDSYGHLNRLRPQIAEAVEQAKAEVRL